MNRKKVGILGEQKAVEFLETKKYRILKQNFRCPYGEIDIIAKDKDTIVFVEVKTRRTTNYGRGMEAVNYSKRQKIKKTALYFLSENTHRYSNLRFDVLDVFIDSQGGFYFEHIQNAF